MERASCQLRAPDRTVQSFENEVLRESQGDGRTDGIETEGVEYIWAFRDSPFPQMDWGGSGGLPL